MGLEFLHNKTSTERSAKLASEWQRFTRQETTKLGVEAQNLGVDSETMRASEFGMGIINHFKRRSMNEQKRKRKNGCGGIRCNILKGFKREA